MDQSLQYEESYIIQYEESVCKKPVLEEDTGINLHDLGLGYEI